MGPGTSLPFTGRSRGGSFPRSPVAAVDPVVYATELRWAIVGSRKTGGSGGLAPRSWRSCHPPDNPSAAAPRHGCATEVGEATPSQLSEEARTVLLSAGPTTLAAANQRLSTILAYLS